MSKKKEVVEASGNMSVFDTDDKGNTTVGLIKGAPAAADNEQPEEVPEN